MSRMTSDIWKFPSESQVNSLNNALLDVFLAVAKGAYAFALYLQLYFKTEIKAVQNNCHYAAPPGILQYINVLYLKK